MKNKNIFFKEKKSDMKIRIASGLAIALTFILFQGFMSQPASAEDIVTVYKSPTCGCCRGWVSHLEANGFKVKAINTDDVVKHKKEAGLPQKLYACHTAHIDGYVIEGHVPASAIKRLLAERPAVTGLAVPGMPTGSPGMGGKKVRYPVVTFDKSGKTTIFSTH